MQQKTDPILGRFFGSTEQIIAWLGREVLFQTHDDEIDPDINEIRLLLESLKEPVLCDNTSMNRDSKQKPDLNEYADPRLVAIYDTINPITGYMDFYLQIASE